MKTNLTRKFSFLLLLLTGVVSFTNAQGVFEITAPASISGSQDYNTANDWGAPFPSICDSEVTIMGDLILVEDDAAPTDDACTAAVNDLTGKIAILERGSCGFSLKALNAQNAGAIGVIVGNNVAGDPAPGMAAGPEAPMVTIPVWSTTKEVLEAIRTELNNGTTVSISAYYTPSGTDEVLWNGGTFDDGLDGWTTVGVSADTAIWVHVPDGAASGPLTNGQTIDSPTLCNGAMIFDSDLYNSTVETQPYPTHSGELISPTIDCSAFDAVSLQFTQYQIMLNSGNPAGSASFAYSLDDGMTWSNNIPIPTENVLTNLVQNIVGTETQRFFLPQIAGQGTVKIKFLWDGDFYFWLLDDVQLVRPEDNNLAVMDNFYAIAPNVSWPASQLAPYSHLADISNIGAADQTGTTLRVTVDDQTGATVYTEDLVYGTTVADSLYENEPFAGTFTPMGDTGTVYTGTYTIFADSADFDERDNSVSYSFTVTDTVFAKENGAVFGVRPADGNWADTEVHSWAFGNFFHVVNGSDAANAEDVRYATSATFGIDIVPAEAIITAYLYEWNDENGNFDAETNERTRVASASIVTDGMEDLLNVIFEPFDVTDGTKGQINLKSDTDYLLMVEYIAPNLDAASNLEVSGASGWDYGAQTLRSQEMDIPYRPADFIAIGRPDDVTFESGTFANIVPAVRLNIGKELVIDVEELDAANIINIMPNPASDFINLQVDLVKNQPNVQVNIVDVTGKTIIAKAYENVSKETFKFDTSNLAAGAYFLNFVTEEGVRTERLMIQR